ncbi:Calx-beta domain-containing protein [Flavivirga sp. 57AJ16]|uniref:T9SS type A sorting domain-containing protein n=1 Tax=Flavivirga sp. 57AJ16 TaxID=3025307 RepID=UPI0023665041|nr:Calx-beta domain-containing protein [Flavivirga sp. 57AJ16]MDD7885586.1 Calx-beta domain-containing protein [Flavivirga sp. 57AJ16]
MKKITLVLHSSYKLKQGKIKNLFSLLLIMMCFQVFPQDFYKFGVLGADDSGSVGFKSISTTSILEGSNQTTNVTGSVVGSELFSTNITPGATAVFTVKADGTNAVSFDVDDLTIFNYLSSINGPSIYTTNTQIVFKNASGTTIRTMTLSANKSLSENNSGVSIGTFFDNNNTLPVTGVSEIEFTVNPLIDLPDAFTLKGITISNVVAGTVPTGSATIDFNNTGVTNNRTLGKTVSLGPLSLSINSVASDDFISFRETSGAGGTGALYDNNADIGGITKWTIKRHGGDEFAVSSIYIQDSGVGASTTGTLKAYKDGAQVGATVNITFDGNQVLSGNTDFQDIDELWIEAADLNVFIDDIIYSIPSTSQNLQFTSDAGAAWNDGIAEDGEGGSSDISGITIEIYNVDESFDNIGVLEWYSDGDLGTLDGFSGLTTFSAPPFNDTWKGQIVKSSSGDEFQINGFEWYDWGNNNSQAMSVIGLRDGSQVASTTFTGNPDANSVSVSLNSDFDYVDEVRIITTSGLTYPSINNIAIQDGIPPPLSPPAVTTNAAISIIATGATLNGDVTSDGGAVVTERGFVYALTSDDATPTVAEAGGANVTKVVVSGTTGSFGQAISSLLASSNYSFSAYAINSEGTTEGTVETFTTLNPTVAFTSTSSSGAESVGSADLEVSLSTISGSDVSVDYVVTGTAAAGGTDYTLADGSLTISAGDGNNDITIASIVPDAILEANETVIVTILNPTNATLGTNLVHTYTINDDDSAMVTIANVSGNENDGAITVTATLDNAVQGGFTVDVSTSDGTATTSDSDYTAVTGQTLTFTGSASETQTFTVTPTGDTKLEANETLTVSQSNLAATVLAVNITDGATVTINNDDSASVTIADVSGNENDGAITVTATLDNAVQGGFMVDVSTSDGTATTGDSDYSAVAGQTLTFTGTASETQTFTVTPTGDTKLEANETLTVSQSNLVATVLTVNITDGATVTIDNDDSASVTIADVSGNENDGAITVTATLDNAVQGGFTVDVSTSDGMATTGDSDYSAVTDQTLTFTGTANETQTFTVTPTGDTKLEANETLTVSQSNLAASALTVNITDGATVTIDNDDSATVTIADVSGNENDGAITVTATLDNAVQGGFTVDVSTSDGTATTSDSDYTAVTGQTLTFTGSASETQTFTVTPTGDTKLEANETLTVSQSNLASTTLSVNITDGATVTIDNDDFTATVLTDDASNILSTSATLGGNVTDEGSTSVTERGIVYALTADDNDPEIGDANTIKLQIGTGGGIFGQSVTGLNDNSGYSYRTYAINSSGTTYGTVKTFTTATLGLEGAPLKDLISLYPNPVEENLHIKTDNVEIEQVALFDVLGKLVKDIELKNQTVDLSSIDPGVYLVRIKAGGGILVKRIIKK